MNKEKRFKYRKAFYRKNSLSDKLLSEKKTEVNQFALNCIKNNFRDNRKCMG